MDLILLFGIAAIAYAIVYLIVRTARLGKGYLVLRGPVISLETSRVGIFDRCVKYKRFFEAYGTAGIVVVSGVSVIITALILLGLKMTLDTRPEPIGVYAPQNIFLVPGINEFIPATIAVWVGIVAAVVVHECGHAILCRVEGIRLKATGILVAVIPLGAFVEPDEGDVERASIRARVAMYGAGIMNNLLVGIVCFALVVSLLATCVAPSGIATIDSVVPGTPAWEAGFVPGDHITAVGGLPVKTGSDVSAYLNATRPGDTLPITREDGSVVPVRLVTRPDYALTGFSPASGYMGASVYGGGSLPALAGEMVSWKFPLAVLRLLTLPIAADDVSRVLKVIVFDTQDISLYTVPFEGFWALIHILFWVGWMNINVGIFNAAPMIPLDGGYIFRDGIGILLARTRFARWSRGIAICVTVAMVGALLATYLVPWLL